MDRAAKLAEVAQECLACERDATERGMPELASRLATYGLLVERARFLGFPEDEADLAVATALGEARALTDAGVGR